jgi:hypothetical protein
MLVGKTKLHFFLFQAIDNGMYEMERREGRGLEPDDDSGMIRNMDDDEDDTDKDRTNEVVVVEETPVLDTSCNWCGACLGGSKTCKK